MNERLEYISSICERSGMATEDVAGMMDRAESHLGVDAALFCELGMEKMSLTEQAVTERRRRRKAARDSAQYEHLKSVTGMSETEIRAELERIGALGKVLITLGDYSRYEMWKLSDEDLLDVLSVLDRLEQIRNSSGDAKSGMEEAITLIKSIISSSYLDYLSERIKPCLEDIPSEEKLRELALDMEATRSILGFYYMEYLSFGFFGKSIDERMTFVSDAERLRLLKAANSRSSIDVLDDKAKTFEMLKSFYNRDLFYLCPDAAYADFVSFAASHGELCVKPTYGTVGRGVRRIAEEERSDPKTLYEQLLVEYRSCVIEEVIRASETLRRLNPDSVNSVRVTTCCRDGRITIEDAFIKLGRRGSFTDNGGSGGIFAYIDKETGVICTAGCDEKGIRYEVHPDTGVRLCGYTLPDWGELRRIAFELASSVEGAVYVGWDLAHSEDNGWVVIEGNAYTQFLGQQCTTLQGKKQELYVALGI